MTERGRLTQRRATGSGGHIISSAYNASARPRSLVSRENPKGLSGAKGAGGSRFGRLHQRHLFNGARGLDTALAERACHALRLLEGSPLPKGARLQRLQTVFTVEISTLRGLALQGELTPQALAANTDPCS